MSLTVRAWQHHTVPFFYKYTYCTLQLGFITHTSRTLLRTLKYVMFVLRTVTLWCTFTKNWDTYISNYMIYFCLDQLFVSLLINFAIRCVHIPQSLKHMYCLAVLMSKINVTNSTESMSKKSVQLVGRAYMWRTILYIHDKSINFCIGNTNVVQNMQQISSKSEKMLPQSYYVLQTNI